MYKVVTKEDMAAKAISTVRKKENTLHRNKENDLRASQESARTHPV